MHSAEPLAAEYEDCDTYPKSGPPLAVRLKMHESSGGLGIIAVYLRVLKP